MESTLAWPVNLMSRKVYSMTDEPGQLELQGQHSGLTVLSIALLTIAVTAFLLASYYLIFTKCCSNCRDNHLLSRFSSLHRRQDTDNDGDDSFIGFSPPMWSRGLGGLLIHEIPTFQFNGRAQAEHHQRCFHGCTVCLNEFQEQDMLKLLPGCSHTFHLDCIDTWLQTNANCPVCRTSITGTAPRQNDSIAAPSSSPQGSEMNSGSLAGRGDEDFIVIELWRGDRITSSERPASSCSRREHSMSDRSEKLEIELVDSKQRTHHHASRGVEDMVEEKVQDQSPAQFQPLRRSFSLDSVSDRRLYLQVQAALLQNKCEECKLSWNQEYGGNVRSIIMLPHGRG